ncbi:MAG: TNT domain-containing protein [Burkholderiales bacterium]|nr:TNT domain-containing protein [Burkholderiales bacterium]
MANYRIPGTLDASRGNRNVLDGTWQRTPGVVPGPVGGAEPGHTSAWDPLNYYHRAQCLIEAAEIGRNHAPAAILRETGHAIAELVKGLLPGLLMMLAVVGATTAIGGAAGGVVGGIVGFFGGAGVGAVPGAAAGAATGAELGLSLGITILTWLGLGFLIVAIGEGLAELGSHVAHATVRAWNAHGHPQRRREIDAAGEEFATSVALLFKLILMAIVARLTMRQAGAATEDTIALLRKSKLGEGFAEWVAANREALLKNPRLRGRQKPAVSEKPVQEAVTPSQAKRGKAPQDPEPTPPPKVTRPDTSKAKYRPDSAYKKPNGDWDWPPNDGFDGARTPARLPKGTEIDRFGGEGGSFVSPSNTPFEQRALAPTSLKEPYFQYEVTRPLPVETGKIAPAFDQPGGGIQHVIDWQTIAQSNNTTVSAIRGYQGTQGSGGIAWLAEQGGYLTRLTPPGGLP